MIKNIFRVVVTLDRKSAALFMVSTLVASSALILDFIWIFVLAAAVDAQTGAGSSSFFDIASGISLEGELGESKFLFDHFLYLFLFVLIASYVFKAIDAYLKPFAAGYCAAHLIFREILMASDDGRIKRDEKEFLHSLMGPLGDQLQRHFFTPIIDLCAIALLLLFLTPIVVLGFGVDVIIYGTIGFALYLFLYLCLKQKAASVGSAMAVDGIKANEALGFYSDNFRDLVRDNNVLGLLAKMRGSLVSVKRNGAMTRVLSILPKLTVELIGFLIFGLVFLGGNGGDLLAQVGLMVALLLGVQKVSPQLSRIFSCLTLLHVGLRVINRLSSNPKFLHTSIPDWINSVLSTRHHLAMLDDDVLFCVRLESISFSKNFETKCRLNFDVKPGDILAIAGISGAGKSTIMDLIAGLAGDFEGEISLNAKYFSNFQNFRTSSFYLFQGRNTLSLEILQKTVPELLRTERRPMVEAFGILGLCESIVSDPKYSCSDQQERYSSSLTTSGGEAQRLLLAHALLSGKKVLLVDEGFSGFGSEQAAKILSYLQMYFEDVAVILVSHDADIQKLCNRVVCLG